jgi:hypothetical protein
MLVGVVPIEKEESDQQERGGELDQHPGRAWRRWAIAGETSRAGRRGSGGVLDRWDGKNQQWREGARGDGGRGKRRDVRRCSTLLAQRSAHTWRPATSSTCSPSCRLSQSHAQTWANGCVYWSWRGSGSSSEPSSRLSCLSEAISVYWFAIC